MQNEIKICRSLDEYENPIWRMPNGMKLDLYTHNSTGNFRAKALDSEGVERQVIVVDDVQDRHAVIYLDEQTLDQIHDITWLILNPESEEYLTDHSYMVGVSKLRDPRTGLPAGIPEEGMDEEFLATVRRIPTSPAWADGLGGNGVRSESASPTFAMGPQFVTGLQEAGPKVMFIPDEEPDVKPSCEVGCSKGVYRLGTICHSCGTEVRAVTDKPLVMSQFVTGLQVAMDLPASEDPVPVKFEDMRRWYSDDRWTVVNVELIERLIPHLSTVWPQLSPPQVKRMAAAILFDASSPDDVQSRGLLATMEEVGLNVSDNTDIGKVSAIQLVIGRIWIAGAIQTPWERGEEINWDTDS